MFLHAIELVEFESFDMNFHLSYDINKMFRSCCWHDVWYGFWRLGKTYPNTSWEDAPVPPSRPIPICDHGEKAHVKQSRYLTTTARAYYCCPYMIVSINFFSLQLDKFDFTTSLSMWLKEEFILQNDDRCSFFPWIDSPVESINSYVPIWYKWIFCISQFQVSSSTATEFTSNDRWGEVRSNYSSCPQPTFVQMRVPFWVGEPTYRIGLHTILVISYSFIG
jgi:hypothetical protein